MNKFLKLTVVAGAALAATQAFAGGFMLTEQSVAGLGRAHAGAGVVGDDLSAVWYNPAGMSLIEGTQFQAGGTFAFLDFELKGQGAGYESTENGRKHGVPIPSMFFVTDVVDGMKFGIGLTVPYGMTDEYSKDMPQRDRGMNAMVKTFDLNPNLSWKLTDRLTFGAGLSVQYAKAALETGVSNVAGNDLKLISKLLHKNVNTVSGRIKADSLAYGFNFGMMWEPTDTVRLGLSYRSAIHHNADGKFQIKGINPMLGAAAGMNGYYSAKVPLTVPQTVLFSSTWKVNEKLRLSGLVRWSDWSCFDTLKIKTDSAKLGMVGMKTVSIQNKWKDTWLVTTGADYTINDAWTVRAGVGYESSTIKKMQYRTTMIPDGNRLWLSAGATWHVTKNLQGDFGFTWLHGLGSIKITENEHSKKVIGKYSTLDCTLVGAQMVYKF